MLAPLPASQGDEFEGNLRSKDLSISIGIFFPPHCPFSPHHSPFPDEVLQGQSLQTFSATFVEAAEGMPRLPSFL